MASINDWLRPRPRASTACHGKVTLTRVGFTYIDDEPYAIDIDTAEVLGEMNEIATTAYDLWKPEYSYTSPMKEAAYHGFVFGSPSPRSHPDAMKAPA